MDKDTIEYYRKLGKLEEFNDSIESWKKFYSYWGFNKMGYVPLVKQKR